MLRKLLEKLGYIVTARSSSNDALDVFNRNPEKFDLILTDMTMPNMTGTKLSEKIREIRPDIPVIICTGYSDQLNEEMIKEFNIQGYVKKPIVIRELANSIRKILDQSSI